MTIDFGAFIDFVRETGLDIIQMWEDIKLVLYGHEYNFFQVMVTGTVFTAVSRAILAHYGASGEDE